MLQKHLLFQKILYLSLATASYHRTNTTMTSSNTNSTNFLLQSLKQHNLRLSGRLPSHYRSFQIHFKTPYHLLLTLGDCIITARLVAKVDKVPPTASKSAQSQGQFKLQVQYQTQRRREIERLVDRILRGSKALDLEELCIIVGQWVWNIDMNVRIVHEGGNEIDAVVLAVVALLLRFRRPQVDIQMGQKSKFDSEDEMFISSEEKVRELLEGDAKAANAASTTGTLTQRVQILDGTERDPISLSVHHVPLTVTFALYSANDDSNRILYLMDPDYQEQEHAQGLITVAVNTHGEICSLEKTGGIALSSQCIVQCVKMATVKVKELSKVLISIVEKDIKKSEEARKLQYQAYNDAELALQEKESAPQQENEEHDNMTDSDVSDISDVEEDEIILPSQQDITRQQEEMLRRMTSGDSDDDEGDSGVKESNNASSSSTAVPLVSDDADSDNDDEQEHHTADESKSSSARGSSKSLKAKAKTSGMSSNDLSAAVLPRKKRKKT